MNFRGNWTIISGVIEWVKTHVCSIAFLQETHIDENIEKDIRNNPKFEIVSSHGTSTSRVQTNVKIVSSI
jgi:hypothetical protein